MKSDRKIKVIIAVNDFLVGGAQKLIVDMLKHMDRSKFEVSLLTFFSFDGRPTMYDLLPPDIEVRKFAFTGFSDIASWVTLIRYLRIKKPDVILSNLFFSNTVVRILKLLVGYDVISVEHNMYIKKTLAQITVDRLLARLTYRVVAVSQAVADFTIRQERIDRQKFKVITNGIDVAAIQIRQHTEGSGEEIKEKFGLGPAEKIIIDVARLTPQKNLDILIDAFSLFSKNHSDYRLILLGGGGLKDRLEHMVEDLGLKGKVILPGVTKDVIPYLAASDFFVSTSAIEGFSIAHAEALACGVPLLTTRTGGTDEMLKEGKNGYFISEASIDAIVAGLERMAGADLKAMGAYASESARQFDISKTVRNYEDLIASVLN